jgi:hypothetical protein
LDYWIDQKYLIKPKETKIKNKKKEIDAAAQHDLFYPFEIILSFGMIL